MKRRERKKNTTIAEKGMNNSPAIAYFVLTFSPFHPKIIIIRLS